MAFVAFRNKNNGEIVSLPEHYADHPELFPDFELYDPELGEYEEDKVVVDDNHILPVDQRVAIVATPLAEMSKDELKDSAKDRGLPVSGTKAELAESIATDIKENN